MSRLATLPAIMVAPNGARRTKADHPALPVTIAETVEAARAAFEAGAGALHAHVRDRDGRHTLDAGLYRELVAEMARQVPDMPVQITTEAVGLFSPEEQRAVVRAVMPEGVSVALREIWPADGRDRDAERFYRWAADETIAVQHILYAPADVDRLARYLALGWIAGPVQTLYVLGRYAPPEAGTGAHLQEFLDAARPFSDAPDWAACAFGAGETACLVQAVKSGGKARIGFENNLIGADGALAVDNAQRVRELVTALGTETIVR